MFISQTGLAAYRKICFEFCTESDSIGSDGADMAVSGIFINKQKHRIEELSANKQSKLENSRHAMTISAGQRT
jgi:hypothetical protein